MLLHSFVFNVSNRDEDENRSHVQPFPSKISGIRVTLQPEAPGGAAFPE